MRAPRFALLTLPLAAIALQAQDSTPARTSGVADTNIMVPVGTRIVTDLQRQIRMRSARAGDTVYLEASIPVVVGNRAVIPAGTFIVAAFDTIGRRRMDHGRYELALRLNRFVFPNGRVLPASLPARADASEATGLREEVHHAAGPIVLEAGAPVVGVAIGAASGGEDGATVGGVVGLAVGGVGAIWSVLQGARDRTAVLDVGLPVEVELREPLVLDTRVAVAASAGSAQVSRAATPRQRLCYRPGVPGTPDIIIPGNPGTPPVGDQPGTPPTPPTVIPGTPDIPATWYPCR